MADKRSIYQFASGQGQQNSLMLMDNPDASASSGYTTEKLSIGELGAVIGAILYTQLLDTNVKNIFGGINELFARCMNIADDYDDTMTYYTGDYVFYQNIFYKCNDDGVTGTWDATKWDITTVADELANGGGGGSGGYPVLYGTTDPTPAQGSDGQLYAKYGYVTGCEVEVTVYKATDARTVSITITENGQTVYSATPSCDIMGEYSEVDTTITLSTGTYSLKHWGVREDVADVKSQFVEIDGQQIGFIADGINSSYTVNGTETVEVEYGGDIVIATWLKKGNDWVPVDDSGAEIDDTTPSVKKVYSSAKLEDLLSDKQDATDNSLTTTDKTIVGAVNELNTNKADNSDIPTKTSDLTNDSGFPVVTNVTWGTTLNVNYIKSNFILFVGDRLFAIWFSGSGYANPSIRNVGSNQSSGGTGTASIDDVTVTRTSSGFTVTTNSNATITVIG